MQLTFTPKGVCARKIVVDVENGVVSDAKIIGGCDGNTKGVCSLVKGMPVDAVIARLKGITCGKKPTSCPDQLAIALTKLKEQDA